MKNLTNFTACVILSIMKYPILLDMLFELLQKRRLPASYFAEKYSLSERTVYRYVGELSKCAPVEVLRGRGGGVRISDAYKLPVGFLSAEAYAAAFEALELAYSESADERFLTALKALSSAEKAERAQTSLSFALEEVLLDGGVFHEKVSLLRECIRERTLLEIEYREKRSAKNKRKVEPILLAFQDGKWALLAFCRVKKEVRRFWLSKIYAAFALEEKFTPKELSDEEVLTLLRKKEAPMVEVRLEISESAYGAAVEKFGVENIRERGEKRFVDALFPDDDTLAAKLLSLGSGITVLKPERIKRKVKALALGILKNY
ncbi:MAG: WYL domain-containing protein [Clostridia bacterium]|nr:WYL domain-containing protein [Clostridia bacterium]